MEPALLRSFRYLLGPAKADAGSEAEVWNDPRTVTAGMSFSLAPGEQDHFRGKFKDFEPHLRDKVRDKIRDYHRHLSPAVYWEEEMIFALSTGADSKKWKSFIHNCIRMYTNPGV